VRSDKKAPLKSDKKSPPKIQKKGTLGYNKKSALLEDAITQMNAGKYGRASSALKDLLTLDPLNAEARRLFATLHLRLGSLMSARTAFESLAREAMERQDYWLAESLLREYLTAGPRCVPFLEMLGHVYEEKGDVMAAVAEYGKAVEVLLEDPDKDHPHRASELFGRIRSIAPGSPVAFRFAAMFDTVTGQVVQSFPQPSEGDVETVTAPAIPISESTVDPIAAVAMPWEQMESTPADSVASAGEEVSTTVGPSETKDELVVAPASAEFVTETSERGETPDLASSAPASDSPAWSNSPLPGRASLADTSALELDRTAFQNEATALDSALPASTAAADAKPTFEVLAEASSHPITDKPASPVPMPWDQVEENASARSPEKATEFTDTHGANLTEPGEADAPVPTVTEAPIAPFTMTDEGSGLSMPERMTGLASLPLQQDYDLATSRSPEVDGAGAIEVDPGFSVVPGGAALTVPMNLEPMSSSIEVLKTASAHPITEPPVSPASMPWDQVEEMSETQSSTAEPESVDEVNAEAPEPAAETVLVNTGAATDSSPTSESSFISSLGLSWEDILAAVTAMQSSPAFPPPTPAAEREPTTALAVPDANDSTATPQLPSSEPEWSSLAPPASDTLASLVENSSPLSAPMPWEQIEVEDVAILRPDPEPEFGPVAAHGAVMAQDSTVVMPVAEAGRDLRGMLSPIADEVIRDGESTSMPDFRNLVADASVEPAGQPSPIHIPPEALKPVEPFEVELVAPSEPPLGSSAVDLTMEQSLRRDGVLSNSSFLLEQPPSLPIPLELTDLITAAPVVDAAVRSVAPSLLDNQSVPQTEPMAIISEAVRIAESDEPTSNSENVARMTQRHVSTTDFAGGATSIHIVSESDVPEAQVWSEPTVPPLEDCEVQSTAASVAHHSDELNLTPVEFVPASEAKARAADFEIPVAVSADAQVAAPTAGAEASTEKGPRILWDDSSSKPILSASTGNLLTRWLRRPADAASTEASPAAAVTGESGSPVAPPPIEQQEAAPCLADRPLDRSINSTLSPAEQSAPRPTRSKPVIEQVWRHVSRAAVSLIGAGVSTTRLMIALVVAMSSLSVAFLAGCLGIIALTWLLLEEQPTAAYRSMTSVPQHSLEDSQKNGYFLLLGFGAAPAQDPVQAGIDRRAEEADRAVTQTCLTGGDHGSGSQQGASAEAAGKFWKSPDPAAQMRVQASGVKSWVSQAGVAMGRYRQWLSKPFEDWGYGQPVSPHCGVILYAHRLYVAEGFAQDVEAGVARVETDLTAWRTVLGQAKTMPVKMLAADALNDDIAVVSGLLVRPDLDDRWISRLAKLARPLDQAEQSIRWPMQSQFVLATKTLDEALSHDSTGARPIYGSLAAVLPLPKQRRFNGYAEYYEVVAKAEAEGRYADLPKPSQFVRTPPYGLADVVVNPIESLVGIEPLPTWEMFAGRVLETDARLRLASLQAWLRRTPHEQNLLTRVAKAGQGLYDPFTGYPMLVNMKKGVFYSVGRDLKDNDAQERFDVVAQIPPTALAGGKRPADTIDSK
jgi:tetratricopeptide (TPR) repeat protein